jgi:dTDP-4-dehydrorhamnose reductase
MAVVGSFRPDVVLNCAAFNQVDDAERDPTMAFRVNAEGVRNLAVACKENGAFLVHYGTDYVFNGRKETPYTEEDEPDPINASKSSSRARRSSLNAHRFLLLRVSWVLGGKQNFCTKLFMGPGN